MAASAVEAVLAALAYSPPDRQRTLMAELASLYGLREAIDQLIREGEGGLPE
jgi:hypothetical protein